jgi:hypothetical protein
LSASRTFPGLIDPSLSATVCNSNLASRYSLAIFGLMINPYSSATARDHDGSPVGLAGRRTRAIRAAALRRSSSVRFALRASRKSQSTSTAVFWPELAADFAFAVLARGHQPGVRRQRLIVQQHRKQLLPPGEGVGGGSDEDRFR